MRRGQLQNMACLLRVLVSSNQSDSNSLFLEAQYRFKIAAVGDQVQSLKIYTRRINPG